MWFGNIFSLLIFAIFAGDDDDAHPPEPPEQGPPPGGLPGPQHRVQDAKPEGEGEFTEEIRQKAGPQRPRVLPGCGAGSPHISPSPRNNYHGGLLARWGKYLSHE